MLLWSGDRCWITTKAAPVSGGRPENTFSSASRPPADAPIATTWLSATPGLPNGPGFGVSAARSAAESTTSGTASAATASGATTVPATAEGGAATPSAGPTARGNGAVSLALKLRLSYGESELRLGAMVRQLGQPQTASALPDLSPLLQDLGTLFGRLTSAMGARGDAAPSLPTFLASLGQDLDAGGRAAAGSGTALAALAPSAGGATGRLLDLRA